MREKKKEKIGNVSGTVLRPFLHFSFYTTFFPLHPPPHILLSTSSFPHPPLHTPPLRTVSIPSSPLPPLAF